MKRLGLVLLFAGCASSPQYGDAGMSSGAAGSQSGAALTWDPPGYYEIALDR